MASASNDGTSTDDERVTVLTFDLEEAILRQGRVRSLRAGRR